MKVLSRTLGTRNAALDFVKGLCVLAMVVNHSTRINSRTDISYDLLYRCMGFATWAFLFLCGFVVGWHYLPGYESDKAHTIKRLLSRALKLVLLVVVLNVPLLLLSGTIRFSSLGGFARDFARIMIAETLWCTEQVSFRILLSIAVVLALAPLVLRDIRHEKRMAVLLVILILVTGYFYSHHLRNLVKVLVGIAGILAGAAVGRHAGLRRPSWAHGFTSVVPWVALLLWYGTFYFYRLQLGPSIRHVFSYPAQVLLETILVLICFYHLSVLVKEKTLLYRTLALLGRYSLFSYLAQMLYIKVFIALLIGLKGYLLLAAVIGLVTLALVGSCMLLDLARQRRPADTLYRLALG